MEQPALQRGDFREWIRCGIQQECEIVVNFDPEPDPGGSKDEHPAPLDTIPSPDGGISHYSWAFPVYCRHIVVTVQKIEDFMEQYVGVRTSMSRPKRWRRLGRLRSDLTDLLTHMEGDWNKGRIHFD